MINLDKTDGDEGARRAVAQCIAIAREVRDGFLSEQYAVGQPVASFLERFACDRVAEAIEQHFGMGTHEMRRLLGLPPLSEVVEGDSQ